MHIYLLSFVRCEGKINEEKKCGKIALRHSSKWRDLFALKISIRYFDSFLGLNVEQYRRWGMHT